MSIHTQLDFSFPCPFLWEQILEQKQIEEQRDLKTQLTKEIPVWHKVAWRGDKTSCLQTGIVPLMNRIEKLLFISDISKGSEDFEEDYIEAMTHSLQGEIELIENVRREYLVRDNFLRGGHIEHCFIEDGSYGADNEYGFSDYLDFDWQIPHYC